MANTASAIKRVRSNERKRQFNRIQRTRARSAVRTAREGLEGTAAEAQAAVLTAAAVLDKAAKNGSLHPRNAARRKGRLMKQLAALSASETK